MLSLATPLEGLGLKVFVETVENEYKDLTRRTSNIQAQILETNNNEGKTRSEIKAEREKRNQEKLRQFLATSDSKKKKDKMTETLNQKGVSIWLTNLPIKEYEYDWWNKNSEMYN